MTQERLPQQLGGVTDDDLHQPDPGAVYSELPTDLAGTVSDPKELDGSEKVNPDAQEVCADPQFQEWVGKSKVRQALLLKAHNTYDVVAGNEVLATWKELKAGRAPVVTPVAPAVTDAKRKAAQRAATGPTGGGGC